MSIENIASPGITIWTSVIAAVLIDKATGIPTAYISNNLMHCSSAGWLTPVFVERGPLNDRGIAFVQCDHSLQLDLEVCQIGCARTINRGRKHGRHILPDQ